MKWHRGATPNHYVLTAGAYQAVVWQPEGSDEWYSQVLHLGQVVQTATFPMLLVTQASCIVQILALQMPGEHLTP